MNNSSPNRLPWIVAALLLVVNLSLLGYMSWGGERQSFPPSPRVDRQAHLISYFQKSIGLDQTQTDMFSTLWEEFHEKAQADRQTNMNIRIQLHEAIVSPTRNQQEVDSLLELTAEKVITHERIVMEHFDKLVAVCTLEQQDKLGEAFTNMMARGPGPGLERGKR